MDLEPTHGIPLKASIELASARYSTILDDLIFHTGVVFLIGPLPILCYRVRRNGFSDPRGRSRPPVHHTDSFHFPAIYKTAGVPEITGDDGTAIYRENAIIVTKLRPPPKSSTAALSRFSLAGTTVRIA